jgi:hypothetical protein
MQETKMPGKPPIWFMVVMLIATIYFVVLAIINPNKETYTCSG